MNNELIDRVFRPRPTTGQAKADAITTNVRAIVKSETEIRNAKTAQLRQLRLARAAIDAN